MADLNDLPAFIQRADTGPVVMLNLLKFKPSGFGFYAQYMAQARPILDRIGATVRYLGRGRERLLGDAADEWDLVLLVEYPTRGVLVDMLNSDEYCALLSLRDEGLERSVLLATDPIPTG